jgi:pimeloyl-ACP methyl ester carboxylesterase
MDDLTPPNTPPNYVTRADGARLAFRHVRGSGKRQYPTLVFLPGYKSDMQGGKAVAVENWAISHGRAMLRLDYSGCGESDGRFEDGTLSIWRDDAVRVIESVLRGPIILIGSSMGGWIALLIALALGSDVKGLVGIAAAPDFTDWRFTREEKAMIERDGRIERSSDYGPEPMVTTRAFWRSGKENRLLDKPIPLTCPVRLIQGQCDDTVPWQTALTLRDRLCSADVQVALVKDGDHRLSRDEDIVLLIATLSALLETI